MSSGLLLRLIEESRVEIDARRRHYPLSELERRVASIPMPRSLIDVLRGERLAVIAEMKAKTPSLGTLVGADDYHPDQLAARYQAAGAAAISVLCQQTSFGGRPEHLSVARSRTRLPLLRKDFVIDEYQVVEARALGADGVLLIVAALSPTRLRQLLMLTWELGMEALVEVHTEPEVEQALGVGARVIGVNHRDLTTFAIDLGLTERLRPLLPSKVIYVAESGIKRRADALRMRQAGADAVLVGEALMRSIDPAAQLAELIV
ncbi:MAG: indole-3-glycerol phosphate synthase TrpC [Candidatus Dormibacteraceae bacterium]